ncbi:MAG TPA: phosphatidate cytidylyltransferase [Bryobacteraceae bacterium]|jgi:phosphatidate cytidylyltransferase
MKRVLTAALLVPTITGLVLWAPRWIFIAAIAIIGVFAFREFSAIASAHGFSVNPWIGSAVGCAMLAIPDDHIIVLLILAIGFGSMMAAVRFGDLKIALPSASAMLLGVCYIFGAWWCAVKLRDIDHWLLFFALALNWIGDTAAMYGGRKFGRHKMSPVVSPGKTWEGAAASVIGSVIFGFALFLNFGPRLPWFVILLLSLIGNVAGQLGDLSESAIKRGAGMKDSGNSLPGHGGWLDRIDSTLFTVPAVYACYQLLSLPVA